MSWETLVYRKYLRATAEDYRERCALANQVRQIAGPFVADPLEGTLGGRIALAAIDTTAGSDDVAPPGILYRGL